MLRIVHKIYLANRRLLGKYLSNLPNIRPAALPRDKHGRRDLILLI